jgi:hypothetical protein
MSGEQTYPIRLTAYQLGGLRQAVRRAIDEHRRWMMAMRVKITPEALPPLEEYAAQLASIERIIEDAYKEFSFK